MRGIVVVDTEEIADEIRDIINWVAVFAQEYDLPAEVVGQLRTRLERVAKQLA